METNCPNCSNRLVLDDSKIPATPFMLKCPKCQGTVKLPGKGSGAPQPETPPPPQPAPVAAAPRPPAAAASPAPAPPAATNVEPHGGRAIVAFPSSEQGNAVGSVLGRLGYAVESLDQSEEKIVRLQHGDFSVIATSRNGVSEDRNIHRMVSALPSDVRRRVFLVLVGDEFHTAEGTQAFAVLADLVLNSKDAATGDAYVAQALGERRRLYQTFWDAEDRKAEGKL